MAGNSTFAITDRKLYVPIVTLSTEDNANFSVRELIDSSCQGINKLFVLAYDGVDNSVTVSSHRRRFLPRVEIKNYNNEIFIISRLIIKKQMI